MKCFCSHLMRRVSNAIVTSQVSKSEWDTALSKQFPFLVTTHPYHLLIYS